MAVVTVEKNVSGQWVAIPTMIEANAAKRLADSNPKLYRIKGIEVEEIQPKPVKKKEEPAAPEIIEPKKAKKPIKAATLKKSTKKNEGTAKKARTKKRSNRKTS